jgi:hypothetical protein
MCLSLLMTILATLGFSSWKARMKCLSTFGAWLLKETCEGLNPNLSLQMEDNSIGKEIRRSWPDYNRPETLRLSNRYTNSHGSRNLVEHDDPPLRAPVLQAIKELARISRTHTEL